ncbi:MAG TPA: STN domain-containing protein [Flavobacteriales bacterium]|nr:STN domain-containing protein [Flavobacteriales bacterium]
MAAPGKLALVLLFALVYGICLSQPVRTGSGEGKTPPLERIVSVKVTNVALGEVLKKVSEQGQFSFSYNSKNIDIDRKITLHLQNKPVRTVLHAIFRGSVVYKSKNNYIILSAAPQKNETDTSPKYLQVSGYTFDKPTSAKLKQVSIFEENTLYSTVSDNYGYFILQVPNSTEQVKLKIRKEGYGDTVIVLSKDFFQAIEIVLMPLPPKIEPPPPVETFIALADTGLTDPGKSFSEKVNAFDFLLNSTMKTNLRNLSDTFFRKTQFSVVPPLSTNKLIGTNAMNNVSFNLFAGYTGGVKYAEIGGLLNVDRGDVQYVQVAGLVNAVGGKTTGFQAAGLTNVCHDDVYGFQVAGLFNINAKQTKGLQIGGLFNYAKSVKGVQVAGLFNYAKIIKGVQVSTFNFADSSAGIPIGFFSFVKHGYHKIELNADEVCYGNLALKTGVEKLHNIFTAGIGPVKESVPIWTFGYGLGTSFKLSPKLVFDIDLVASHYAWKMQSPRLNADTLIAGTYNAWMNMNNKIYLGIDWRFAKKISLAAGPTLNIFLTDTRNTDYTSLWNELRPSYLYSEAVDTNLQMHIWIGGKIALRFF